MAHSFTARTIAYIPVDSYVEGAGYRVSIVNEEEYGHRPTGTWPYTGKPGETVPWFWGPTLEDALRCAESYNERAGISKREALLIVSKSMSRDNRRRKPV